MCVSNQTENHSVFITNYHPTERKKNDLQSGCHRICEVSAAGNDVNSY